MLWKQTAPKSQCFQAADFISSALHMSIVCELGALLHAIITQAPQPIIQTPLEHCRWLW